MDKFVIAILQLYILDTYCNNKNIENDDIN